MLMLIVFSPEEIRLEKFQEAVDDCNHVLSMEPKNVKGKMQDFLCDSICQLLHA